MNKAYLISGVYIAFGTLWIYYTDDLVFALFHDHPQMLHLAESSKGVFFVVGSGVLIFLLNFWLNRKLTQRNEELSLFVNSGDLGFVRFDNQGKVIEVNAFILELTGYTSEEIHQKNYQKLFSVDAINDLEALKTHPGLFGFNAKIRTSFDQEIQVRIKSAAKKNRWKEVEYLALIIEDITDELTSAVLLKDLNLRLKENANKLKESNTLLELENIRANQSNQLKSNFMAKLSHELRTPLNGILGIAEIIQAESAELDPIEINEYINIQKTSAHRLLDTLNSILAITEVEGKASPLKLTLVDLQPLMHSLKIRFQEFSHSDKEIIFQDAAHHLAMADLRALEQILIKLIENAIQFTAQGKIEISVATAENFISISVSDTGVGIAKDRQTRIFDPFYQDQQKESNMYYGSGLGLSLVKKYTELIGGEIEVKSEIGQGSTFTLTLPTS